MFDLDAASEPHASAAAADQAACDAAPEAPRLPDRRVRTIPSPIGIFRDAGPAQLCLARGKGNLCTYCGHDLPRDPSEFQDTVVSCAWRGGLFHTRCSAIAGKYTASEEDEEDDRDEAALPVLFVCNACTGGAAKPRRRASCAEATMCARRAPKTSE